PSARGRRPKTAPRAAPGGASRRASRLDAGVAHGPSRGVARASVEIDAHDPAVAHGPHLGVGRAARDLDPAPLPHPAVANERDDLLAGVNEALERDREVVPRLEE